MLIKILFIIKTLVFASLSFGSDSEDSSLDSVDAEILAKEEMDYDALLSQENAEIIDGIFTHQGRLALAGALMKSQKAKSLNLIDNELGNQGIGFLVTALKTNTSLTSLSLRSDNFGDEGCACFGDLLRQNTPLKILSLEFDIDQNVTPRGLTCIVSALFSNTTLTKLELHGYRLDAGNDKVVSIIADVLKTNTSLRDLSLKRSLFEATSGTLIAQALGENSTLTRLDLAYCHGDDNTVQNLADSLTKNTNAAHTPFKRK